MTAVLKMPRDFQKLLDIPESGLLGELGLAWNNKLLVNSIKSRTELVVSLCPRGDCKLGSFFFFLIRKCFEPEFLMWIHEMGKYFMLNKSAFDEKWQLYLR